MLSFLSIIRCLAVLALVAVTSAAAAPGKATPDGARKDAPAGAGAPKAPAAEEKTPLRFFVARSPNGCGNGCNEWIAAEGSFVAESPERFRAVLRETRDRKLPVYFHSPGGLLSSALAIGRAMRAQGVTAGVGLTLPRGCVWGADKDAACMALKTGKEPVDARLLSWGAGCNSACVYALAGGKVRDVPPGARVGVHSAKLVFPNLSAEVRASRRFAIEYDRQYEAGKTQTKRYLREMAVDPALVDKAYRYRFDQIYILTRDEIAGFGLDRRGLIETGWQLIERPSSAPTIRKFVVDAKKPDADFHTSLFQLQCLGRKQAGLVIFRALGDGDPTPKTAVEMRYGEKTAALRRLGDAKAEPSVEDGTVFDHLVAVGPLATFETVAASPSFAIRDVAAEGAPPGRTLDVSTAGLADAVKALQQHCGPGT